MQKHLFQQSVRWALAAVFLSTIVNSAPAGSFTRGCAARDLQILMLIEERESANSISAEKVSDAIFAMLNARMVCYEGRVVDALALYDGISQSMTPYSLLSDRAATKRPMAAPPNQP
jgi:hypothetical protein